MNFPYHAYDTLDKFGRTIHFYLTDDAAHDDRPLIVVIQGSGCGSQFGQRDGHVTEGWFAFARQSSAGRAQLLVVEKPGVTLFGQAEQQGAGASCSEQFRTEQTSGRWVEALAASVRGVTALRGMAPRRTLALGHSEGGAMALPLALAEPSVTHVAMLSGTAQAQLQDFVTMAATDAGFIASAPGTRAEHLGQVLDAWKAIEQAPDSIKDMQFGHAHRYWSERFAPFDWSQLGKTSARFLIVHADADTNAAVQSADSFAVELIVRHRDLTWMRIAGADHGFTKPGASFIDSFPPVIAKSVAWFLDEPFDRKDVIWPR